MDELSRNDAFDRQREMCKKLQIADLRTKEHVLRKNFFQGGAIVKFARWWANAFFQEWANSDQISFYQLETKKQTFFC